MWKVGVIGLGFWSENHLKAWKRIPSVEIRALCDTDSSKLTKNAQKYQVPSANLYTSIEKMLKNAEIDFVDIVTGPATHLSLIKLVTSAGKHFLCQKPLSATLEEAEEMVQLAKEADVRFMVTENWRWLQPFQKVKQVLDKGALGKINIAKYIHTDYFTPLMEPTRQMDQPFLRTMPKLMFYEMGAHWFDTWRFLFGDPKRLYAEMKQISPYVSGEDTGTILLGYDDFYGFMDMNWATRNNLSGSMVDKVQANHIEHLIVEGNEATLMMFTNGCVKVIDNQGNETIIEDHLDLSREAHEESHFRLSSHFISCLDSGEEFQTSGEHNLKTLQFLFAAYESAVNHKVITFDSF